MELSLFLLVKEESLSYNTILRGNSKTLNEFQKFFHILSSKEINIMRFIIHVNYQARRKKDCSRWGSNSQPRHISRVLTYKYRALTNCATGAYLHGNSLLIYTLHGIWNGESFVDIISLKNRLTNSDIYLFNNHLEFQRFKNVTCFWQWNKFNDSGPSDSTIHI